MHQDQVDHQPRQGRRHRLHQEDGEASAASSRIGPEDITFAKDNEQDCTSHRAARRGQGRVSSVAQSGGRAQV